MDNTTTVPAVNRELVISSDVSEVNIVLLEDKQLVELHKEQINSNFSVGDVYYGRVKKILPGLNAAFVDIGNLALGFAGNYAPRGLTPQTDGMPVILRQPPPFQGAAYKNGTIYVGI